MFEVFPAGFADLPADIRPDSAGRLAWAYEIKHDGFRFLCRRDGNNVRDRRGYRREATRSPIGQADAPIGSRSTSSHETNYPGPQEQADALILWIGDNQESPERACEAPELFAGCLDRRGLTSSDVRVAEWFKAAVLKTARGATLS